MGEATRLVEKINRSFLIASHFPTRQVSKVDPFAFGKFVNDVFLFPHWDNDGIKWYKVY